MAKKGNFIASGSTTLEAPDVVRAAFLTLPIYLLTPTPARMTMKIGKTIWARTTLDRQIHTWSRWFRITIARFDRAMNWWAEGVEDPG